MKLITVSLSGIVALLLSGCMSQPKYKDSSDQDNLSSKAMGIVNYKINPDITGAPLSCVTVMPLHLSDESQEVIEFTPISLGEEQEFSQLAYDHKLKPTDKSKRVFDLQVETAIADHPPHRSGRDQFGHPVPR